MTNSKLARAIIHDFQEKIHTAERNKRRVIQRVQKLKKRYDERQITYEDYSEEHRQKIEGRTLEEWTKYYNSYITYCKNEIKKNQSQITQKKALTIVLTLILIISLLFFVTTIKNSFIGFSIQETGSSQEQEQSSKEEPSSEKETFKEITINSEQKTLTKKITENNPRDQGRLGITSGSFPISNEKKTISENEETETEQTQTTITPYPSSPPSSTGSNHSDSTNGTSSNETGGEDSNFRNSGNDSNQNSNSGSGQITGGNQTNITLTNQTNITTSEVINQTSEITITTTQARAVLGQPVRWEKNIKLKTNAPVKIKLPVEAEKISVKKINKNEEANFRLTGQVISGRFIENEGDSWLVKFLKKLIITFTGMVIQDGEEGIEIEIDDTGEEYIVEYETPAPLATEEELEKGKRVKVSGPENLHYENVLAFTNLNEELNILDKSKIRIYWIENDTMLEVDLLEDTNNNGIYDYIEWTIPHLSNQTFEIIYAIDAEHLDQNRNLISNIYQNISKLDGNWSETIHDGHYVRVVFEKNLTEDNDITIFPRIVSGNPRIEIYEVNKSIKLAEFSSLNENEYNKIYLTNLTNEQDTFDLKILNGSVELDHIIDPTVQTGDGTQFLSSKTQTFTIDEVDMSQTFILGQQENGADTRPQARAFTPKLENSTTINFTRYELGSTTPLYYQAIESPRLTVQRGEESLTNGVATKNITIDAVNLTEAFVIVYGRCHSSSNGRNHDGFFSGNLTNSTNLLLRRGEAACAATATWQVVEYEGSTVQSGETTLFGANTLKTATIDAVNLTETFLIFDVNALGTDPGMDTNMVSGNFSNTTTIQFNRYAGVGASNNRIMDWYAVTIPGANVQTGVLSTTSSTPTDITISSVDTSRTFVRKSHFDRGTGTSYDNQESYSIITSSTNLKIGKATSSQTTTINWQVIELPTYYLKWQDNSTNSTNGGENVQHKVNWTDEEGLAGYIFSFDNGTGTFVNDSWVSMTGTQNWSNVTKFTNSSGSSTIRWIVYANNTYDLWNVTAIFSYTTPSVNSAPTIGSVEAIGSINPIESQTKTITFNFIATDTNGASDLDPTTAEARFTISGETTRLNTSCIQLSISGNDANYSCSVGLEYWDKAGTWSINVTIDDNSGESAENSSTSFTYTSLTAMVMSPTTLSWNPSTLRSTDIGATGNPITINNTGNAEGLSINFTAFNLQGTVKQSEFIYAENFTISNITAGCSGNSLVNATGVNITSAVLERGNNTIAAGDSTSGQEQIYVCLKGLPSDISAQAYKSQVDNPWKIEVWFVPVVVARKRKKKKEIRKDKLFKAIVLILEGIKRKENLTNLQIINRLLGRLKKKSREEGKLISAIDYLTEELGEKYKLNETAVIKELISELSSIYKIRKSTLKGLKEIKRIEVPLSIFSNELGSLETIVKYMRENLDMSYAEIARDLNRDQRTIWTSYYKASKKKLEMIEPKENEELIPVSLFQDRRITILESIVVYLKENKMKYSEIARDLNKDQRNIWTIYSRATKKLAKEKQ